MTNTSMTPLPALPFHTTSTMTQTGSAFQSAAVTGYVSSDDYYSATGYRASARRGTNPFGDQTTGDTPLPDEPGATPLGDGLGFLLLLALLYVAIRKTKHLLWLRTGH